MNSYILNNISKYFNSIDLIPVIKLRTFSALICCFVFLNHTYSQQESITNTCTDGTNVLEGLSSTGNLTAAGHILPGANDTYDLGASGNVWRNIYTGDLHLSNKFKEKGNIVDGTKGNWTLQEGENDIFMINNISGEKFKINLSKI
mgnify:CR=1 FL=1